MERMVIALESIAESLKFDRKSWVQDMTQLKGKTIPIGKTEPGKMRQFEINRLPCPSCKTLTDHEVTDSWIHCTYCGLLSAPWEEK